MAPAKRDLQTPGHIATIKKAYVSETTTSGSNWLWGRHLVIVTDHWQVPVLHCYSGFGAGLLNHQDCYGDDANSGLKVKNVQHQIQGYLEIIQRE